MTDEKFHEAYRKFFEEEEIMNECCGSGDESGDESCDCRECSERDCGCPDCSAPECEPDPEPDDTKREETFDEKLSKMSKMIEEWKKKNPPYNPTYPQPQWPSPSLPYYPIVPYQPYWEDHRFWVGTDPRYLTSPICDKTTVIYTAGHGRISWK